METTLTPEAEERTRRRIVALRNRIDVLKWKKPAGYGAEVSRLKQEAAKWSRILKRSKPGA